MKDAYILFKISLSTIIKQKLCVSYYVTWDKFLSMSKSQFVYKVIGIILFITFWGVKNLAQEPV
jgi:hypothetical protein